jgi:hypothetical protein
LGITNNWALIGFAPLFAVAIAWIKGFSALQFAFLLRMLGCGLAGLSLYLVLPLAWALSDHPTVGFVGALRANLAFQKAMLFNNPGARFLAIILGTTAILPMLIIGIRWPTSFGDTSALGQPSRISCSGGSPRVIWRLPLGCARPATFSAPRSRSKRLPSQFRFSPITTSALSVGCFTR